MSKVSITREEQIPFRETDWTVMQMVQHKIWVTVVQEEWETIKDIEEELELIFNRNYWKVLDKDIVYQNQKTALNFLVNEIKKTNPTEAKKIILKAKSILQNNWIQNDKQNN